MTSIYPEVDGPPTKPGWYWLRDEEGIWRVVRVCVSLDYGLSVGGRAMSDYCAGRTLTWYGPIPEPLTADREPCAAWKDLGQGYWALLTADGQRVMAESWPHVDQYEWQQVNDQRAKGIKPTLKEAQLAAEDAVLAEAWKRIETIRGTDHGK